MSLSQEQIQHAFQRLTYQLTAGLQNGYWTWEKIITATDFHLRPEMRMSTGRSKPKIKPKMDEPLSDEEKARRLRDEILETLARWEQMDIDS